MPVLNSWEVHGLVSSLGCIVHYSPGAACLCCFFVSWLDTQMLFLLFRGFSVDLDILFKRVNVILMVMQA